MTSAESEFYLGVIASIVYESRAPLNVVRGVLSTLKSDTISEVSGDEVVVRKLTDEVRYSVTEWAHAEIARITRNHAAIRATLNLALDRYVPFGSEVDTRELADQALERLGLPRAGAKAVSGKGARVEVEDEIRDGFVSLVARLAGRGEGAYGQTRRFTIEVDGTEITLSVPDGETDWSMLLSDGTSDRLLNWEWELAVRLIRARGGSVERDGRMLRVRFDQRDPF